MRAARGGDGIAHYRSYVVRVWSGAEHERPRWAGRVECIQDGAQAMRFNDPEALLGYLRSVLMLDQAADRARAADSAQEGKGTVEMP